MAFELFTNQGQTTVSAGGTTAPAAGTVESWTVSSSAGFPAVSATGTPPTQFHVADPAAPSETVLVTNVSGTTWTVTRGSDGTTPVAHAAGFTIRNVLSSNTMNQVRLMDWINVVYHFGADPTGVADSTTAFANAISALGTNGGTIYVPEGTYTISTGPLVPVTGMRITGDGWNSTVIQSTTNAIFNMGSGFTDSIEIDHVTLEATNAPVFSQGDCSRLSIHDCRLRQNSAGFSIWDGSAITQMIECAFRNNREDVATGRTVPAWNWICTGTSLNNNSWENHRLFDSGTATTWWYKIAYSAATGTNGQRNNVFKNITIEVPAGGFIRLESCTGTEIDSVAIWDLAANTVQNSMISVVKNATAPSGSASTTIRNYDRMGGSSWAAGTSDIQLDVNCTHTVIQSPSLVAGGAALTIDLGSSAACHLSGMPASYTLLNAANASFGDVNGAIWNPPASPVPDNLGFVGWAFDNVLMQGTGSLLTTAGVLFLAKVELPAVRSVTGIRCYLTAAGSGLTAGQNFIGLYSSSGSLIGTSADQSTAWTGTGVIDAVLTGGPFAAGGTNAGGFVWVAWLYNGTTAPTVGRSFALSAGMANGKLTAATSRAGSILTAQTSLPASFTPSSITQISIPWWAALY